MSGRPGPARTSRAARHSREDRGARSDAAVARDRERRSHGLSSTLVIEAIVAGCALGLLLTRPRWGRQLLDVLASRPWDAEAPDTRLH